MDWFIQLITFNKLKPDPEQTADWRLLDAAASGDTRSLSFLLQSDSCSVNTTNKQVGICSSLCAPMFGWCTCYSCYRALLLSTSQSEGDTRTVFPLYSLTRW